MAGVGSDKGDGRSVERSRAVREKRAPPRAGRHVRAGRGLVLLPSLFSLTGSSSSWAGCCAGVGAPSTLALHGSCSAGLVGRGRERSEQTGWLFLVLVLPGAQRSEHRSAEPPPAVGRRGLEGEGGGLLIQPKEVLILCAQILHSVQGADFALCTGCRFCTLYRVQILHSDCGFALESCGILEVRTPPGGLLPPPPPIGYPGSLPAGASPSSARVAGGGQTKMGPRP